MSLKLVNFMWQTAKQNKNSEEIARQAAAMYDKLALFVEELDRVEGHLDKAKDGYSEARKKLATGKGNLISRAEKIKTLGVAPKKQLSE
jgi:DNA recombination protein RmuC